MISFWLFEGLDLRKHADLGIKPSISFGSYAILRKLISSIKIDLPAVALELVRAVGLAFAGSNLDWVFDRAINNNCCKVEKRNVSKCSSHWQIPEMTGL